MGGVSSIAFFLDFFKLCKSPYAVYVCDTLLRDASQLSLMQAPQFLLQLLSLGVHRM